MHALIDADSHGVDVVSQAFVTKIHPELFQSKSIMNCGDKEIHLQMVYFSLLCFFHVFHPWPVVFIDVFFIERVSKLASQPKHQKLTPYPKTLLSILRDDTSHGINLKKEACGFNKT